MICWEECMVVSPGLWPGNLRSNHSHEYPGPRPGLIPDFRADAAIGINLQKHRMSEPPVDHVRLADAGTEALQTGFHLRNHAFVNSAALNELPASARIEAAQERTFVFLVLENAGRVGQD